MNKSLTRTLAGQRTKGRKIGFLETVSLNFEKQFLALKEHFVLEGRLKILHIEKLIIEILKK